MAALGSDHPVVVHAKVSLPIIGMSHQEGRDSGYGEIFDSHGAQATPASRPRPGRSLQLPDYCRPGQEMGGEHAIDVDTEVEGAVTGA